MKKTTRQVKEEIWDSLSIEDKLHEVMLRKVSQLILKGHMAEATTIGSASKILFPKKGEAALNSIIFEALWKKKKYNKALQAYYRRKKPFWLAEKVGCYYERKGQLKKAMQEYEYLINEYKKIKLLPLPNGPVELYKLGRYYINKNKIKARQYLMLYLSADKCKNDPAFYLPKKREAENMLNKLKTPID